MNFQRDIEEPRVDAEISIVEMVALMGIARMTYYRWKDNKVVPKSRFLVSAMTNMGTLIRKSVEYGFLPLPKSVGRDYRMDAIKVALAKARGQMRQEG